MSTDAILRFEEQVRRFRDQVCLVGPDGTRVTYGDVDAAASGLAAKLIGNGIGPEDVVVLRIPRSVELVIGMVAVLRAGAAFFVVDPGWPVDRASHAIARAGAAVIVGPDLEVERLYGGGIGRHSTGAERNASAGGATTPVRTRTAHPRQLAYLVATSGSTGEPKLVQVERGSFAAMVDAYVHRFALGPDDRGSFLGDVSFDAILCEVWPLLCAGGRVYLAPEDARRVPSRCVEWMAEHSLTFVWLPTPTAELLLSGEPEIGRRAPSLRILKTAGERLRVWPPDDLGCPLINCYGPAETTVIATAGVVDPQHRHAGLPSIGTALDSCRIYLLGPDLQPLERGRVGEVYIGGHTVGRGYLGQAALTAERFVPDPFAPEPGARMYATGDLCRELEEGALEFVGRLDDQVKVRGARVELGEIEAHLLAFPGVQCAAAVQVPRGSGSGLVAFAVVDASSVWSSDDLLSHLRTHLAPHAVPRRIHLLPTLPLGPTGKIDRRALQQLAADAMPAASPPDAEGAGDPIAMAFSEILGLRDIPPTADFFDLGGDSISAVLLIERLRREHGLSLAYRDFLTAASLQAVRARLDRSGEANPAVVRNAQRPGVRHPVTGAQRLIWFQSMLWPRSTAYHARAMVLFEGPTDAGALREALQQVVEQHEVFRTTFHTDGVDLWQVVHDPWTVELPVTFLSESSREHFIKGCERLLASMDSLFVPGELPLLRWRYVQGASSLGALLQIEHHLVHDGWSSNLLLDDLLRGYAALREGRRLPLREGQLQCADFARAELAWQGSAEADRQREFWRRELAGSAITVRPLAWGPGGGNDRGRTVRRQLSREIWHAVEAAARRHRVTPFTIFMSCLGAVLRPFAETDILAIGTAAANRNRPGSTTIVGPLLNTLAVPIELDPDRSVAEFIRGVKGALDRALGHQELPYLSVVEAVQPERDRRENPLFQVFLGFHDSPAPQVEVPDVRWQVLEALGGGSAKFDLSLIVIPRPGQVGDGDPVHCIWEHRVGIVPAEQLERLIRSFEHVLDQVLRDPGRLLGSIDTVHPRDRQAMLSGAGHITDESPFDPVVEVVARHISEAPADEAIVAADERLTYSRLGSGSACSSSGSAPTSPVRPRPSGSACRVQRTSPPPF